MGGKGSGKRGSRYHFDPDVKARPVITWRNKSLRAMEAAELKAATRYLVEAWEAALPDSLVYAYCGLDEYRVGLLMGRDPNLAGFKEHGAERLVAQARVNVSKEIYHGGVKDSRWLLEKVDPEFNPGAVQQRVVTPVEEKQQIIQQDLKELVENIKGVEFSDEGTENTSE